MNFSNRLDLSGAGAKRQLRDPKAVIAGRVYFETHFVR
jgi:hypothetical protein